MWMWKYQYILPWCSNRLRLKAHGEPNMHSDEPLWSSPFNTASIYLSLSQVKLTFSCASAEPNLAVHATVGVGPKAERSHASYQEGWAPGRRGLKSDVPCTRHSGVPANSRCLRANPPTGASFDSTHHPFLKRGLSRNSRCMLLWLMPLERHDPPKSLPDFTRPTRTFARLTCQSPHREPHINNLK